MTLSRKLFQTAALAVLALCIGTIGALAQPGGTAVGSATLDIAPNHQLGVGGATLSGSLDVTWEEFQPTPDPQVVRANIVSADLRTPFWNTQLGPDSFISLRHESPNVIYVRVCHWLRVCYWPCPGCCIPVWRLVCWWQPVAISGWESGDVLTLELEESQDFDNFAVNADGTSFTITIP